MPPSRPRSRPLVPALAVGLAALLLPSPGRAAQATLSWDANTEPDLLGYKVYYDRDSGAPYAGTDATEGPSPIQVPLATLADPAHPSFTLTGLDSCTRYYFAVSAYNPGGESGLSPEATAVIVAAPAGVTVAPSGARALRVSWAGPPTGDAGAIPTYRVHYDIDSGQPYAGTDAAEGPSPVVLHTASLFDPLHPSQELTQLRAGQTYYVAVESVCDDGTAKLAAEATGATAAEDDAGVQRDGGPADSGAADDGGGPGVDRQSGEGGEIRVSAGTCSCRGAGGGGAGPLWVGMAVLLWRRQRASCARAGRRNSTRCRSRSP